jgi:hypothetical protein
MYATAIARTVLMTKSPAARAFAATITKGKSFTHSAETRAKLSDALRRRRSMSDKELREHVATRRAKWLTDVIVTRGDHKVFALAGICEGQPYDIHITMPIDVSLLDFLNLVWRCKDAPMTMRIDAAKTACLLMYRKKAREVVVKDDRRKGGRT